MPNGVFADAWLVIDPLPSRRKQGERLIIPCENVYEARAMKHTLVTAGAPRKRVVVSGGYLPARPPSGGVYRIITMQEAVEVVVPEE